VKGKGAGMHPGICAFKIYERVRLLFDY